MHRTVSDPARLVLAVTILAPLLIAQCPTKELLPGDGHAGDKYGGAVAIGDPWILVGASLQDEVSSAAGAVYVMRRDDHATPLLPTDDLWIQYAKLVPPPSASLQAFGASLALDGPWAAIGVSLDSDGAPYSGAVDIYFRQDGGTPADATDDVWTFQTKLKAANPMQEATLGSAVALDGPWLAAAQVFDDTGGTSAGAVLMFHRDDAGTAGDPSDDTWEQQAEFHPVAPAAYHLFGESVAMAGGTLVIGEPIFVDVGQPGLAHVYRLDDAGTPGHSADDTWQLQAELVSDGLNGPDGFGNAVAVEPDWIFVGAPGDDEVEQNVGAVYVFRRDDRGTPLDSTDDGWLFHSKLLIPADGYVPYAQFGWALAVDGDVLVAGANLDAVGTGQAGSAFVFRRSDAGTPLLLADDAWLLQARVVADKPGHGDDFGASLAIDAGTAVVGAPYDNDLALDAGSAQVFAIETGAWEWLGQSLAGSGAPPCLFGSGRPSAGGSVGFALQAAPASAISALIIGASAQNASFKGGVLVPVPDRIVATLSDPSGALSATAPWPPGLPSGLALWMQVWSADAQAPFGWIASNALKLSVP